ncbi:hypothetical protein DdX_13302 [Ditylenchus destructor]|uniref:Uncharacterized protein n=1 Tax=Ditylenchus destructor TaxID=166010 RepID=A0AAD4R2X0_9BILA|nr:hypothetical protein DdX_13302 [Ditylenchus destructor]
MGGNGSRNYKVCHTKAVNEPDKVMRDVLLDKFANKIWDSEGSGQCNHRMRCILNQETIARLWPKYKDCIDNSWKIMVFDDDELHNFDTRPVSRTPTGSSDSRSHHRSTSGLYGQPEDSTLKSAEENPVGLPPARSPNQSPEMDSLRCGQAEKSRSLRRERSRSKSRYSRSRVRSRSSSYEPDRKRRSRDDERQNEPSRSKSPAREFETKDAGKVDSWDENAASFLYKIGDREGALKPKAGPSASIEDRLRSMVPRDSLGAQEKIRLLTELDKPEDLAAARPEHTAQTVSPQTTASRFAAKNAAQVQAMDDATKHRKVVGAMVQLRSMADAEGGMVSNDTFFAICEEVGLPPDEVFVNQTLQQFIAYFTAIIDVRSAYQQYLACKESQLAPPMLSVQSQPGQEPLLTTQQIRDILNKIDIGEQSQP